LLLPNSNVLIANPRFFTHTLVFGAALVAAAVSLRGHHFTTAVPVAPMRAPIVSRLMVPAVATPSAFDIEAGMTSAQLLDRWDPIVTDAAKKFHVPKAWIRAVMRMESGGRTMLAQDQPMVSSAGAQGLMQVLPQTYNDMRAQYGLGADPFNPHDNIFAGAAYLRLLQQKYGFPAMFAAYNAGPGRLEDHMANGGALPAETRAYIGGITRVLNPHAATGDGALAQLTGPDGATLRIDAAKVTAVRAATPGEYAPGVQSVISLGKRQQGVQETVALATAAIRSNGGLI
jgi:soluble lytic murein transglycosylase-like protein